MGARGRVMQEVSKVCFCEIEWSLDGRAGAINRAGEISCSTAGEIAASDSIYS